MEIARKRRCSASASAIAREAVDIAGPHDEFEAAAGAPPAATQVKEQELQASPARGRERLFKQNSKWDGYTNYVNS